MPPAFRKLTLADLPGVIDEVLARRREAASFTPPSPPPTPRERAETLVQRGVFSAERPESVASALAAQGQERPPCRALTRAGQPCRATPRAGTGLCIFHDPVYAGQHRLNSREGGVASGVARQPLPLDDPEILNFADRTGIQAAIDGVLRLELCGKIPPSRSRAVVRLLSLAVNNFDRAARDGCYDAVVAAHDPAAYRERRQAFHERIEDLVADLHADELNRRVAAIADVGSKRQEFLKANELFAPPPPPLRASDYDWPNDWMAGSDT